MSPRDDVPFLHDPEDDETVRLLRRALKKEAEMVEPRDDGLADVQRRTGEGGGRRWVPWAAGIAAAAVIGLVVGGVVGLGDDADPVPPAAEGTAEPTTSPTAAAPTTDEPTTDGTDGTAGPGGETLEDVPVYYLGQSATGVWLYREFHDVPDVGGEVASAVMAMTRQEPRDPDYASPWSPASSVEVTQDGDALTVDLSEDAFTEGTGSEVAERAIQQLVYTATAAASTTGPVTITVDGEPYDAWGVIRVGEPMERAPMVDVQAQTWILSPTEGETVTAGAVPVEGYGTAFEATFGWELVDATTGDVVADGFTTGEGGMGTYGDFSFEIPDVEPGQYVLEVWGDDPSDGESPEGPRMFPDSKAFTVE